MYVTFGFCEAGGLPEQRNAVVPRNLRSGRGQERARNTKIDFPAFPFILFRLHATSSDQSVLITIVRDLLSIVFSLLCYE